LLPETPRWQEEELALHMAIAAPLTATKGYASPEVESAYRALRDLCHRLGRPSADLFPALRGLWNCYTVRGELRQAGDLAEQLARLADAQQPPLWRALSCRALGTSLLLRGRISEARRRLEDGIRFSDAVEETGSVASSLALYGEHPGIVCRVHLGRALWYLGFPDRGLARAEEALAMARSLGHAHMLAFALGMNAVVRSLRREHGAALRRGEEAIAVATEQGLPQWLSYWGGSSPLHEPRHQRNGAFVQHAFVVVVFVHVTLVRAPAHPLRFRRQVPIVWVASYSQPRFDLALAAPRPIILSLELGGIGYLPPPVVAATKPARARRLPKHGNEAPGDGTREVPLPAAEMAGLR
jgi:tetratricopeptide (TPR) repeat protein